MIGTNYGAGDGSTTFNVPDYRGRFLRGVDGGSNRDPEAGSRTNMATGVVVGGIVGSVQNDQFASHTHAYANRGDAGGVGTTVVAGFHGNNYGTGAEGTGPAGGTETRPKNAYVNFIIKY